MQSTDIYKMQMIEKVKEMIIGKNIVWHAKGMTFMIMMMIMVRMTTTIMVTIYNQSDQTDDGDDDNDDDDEQPRVL